jgi:hypothetical protein
MRLMRLELITIDSTNRYSNQLSYNPTKIINGEGFEPTKILQSLNLQSSSFNHLVIHLYTIKHNFGRN